MNQRRRALQCLVMAVAIGLSSCGKLMPKPPAPPPAAAPAPAPELPKPVLVTLTLQASATLNPSESNRPSPVVVRVYKLRSEVRFRAASYDSLYDDDKAALQEDMVDRTPMTLRPGDQTPVSLLLGPEVRFIGVAAFFRQYDNVQWQIVIPTPIKSDGTIRVDKSVSFTAK